MDGPAIALEDYALGTPAVDLPVGNLVHLVVFSLARDHPHSTTDLNRQLTPEREIKLVVRDGFPPELPDGADVELLRVLQEALANVRRHSAALRVEVILSAQRRRMRAEVADDGRGFDPASVREGLGISGMRERASALGGRLEIESEPGKGTSVGVEIPL